MKKKYRGRPIQTVWLPGDKLSVTEIELRRAIRRDNQLNPAERYAMNLVWACKNSQKTYHWWKCTYKHPCLYCGDMDP